jgi:carbon starvation protein
VGVAIGGKIGGVEAWNALYGDWATASGLGAKIGAFVTGSVNMIACAFGQSKFMMTLMATMMGVFIVSFAGTSLDTATRAQRYIIQEIGSNLHLKFLTNKFIAAFFGVLTAWLLTLASPGGKGALVLWPLFGTVNQLLAGLALLVTTIYLIKKKARFVFTLIPMIFMVIMTGWAMLMNIQTFHKTHNQLLFVIAIIVFILMVWLIIEAIVAIHKAKRAHKQQG